MLERVAMKDEEAFNKIYNFYCDRVYAFSRRILQNDFLAEEVVQDVFTKFWQYDQLAEIEDLYLWIRALARNQSLKILRRQAVEVRAGVELAKTWVEHGDLLNDQVSYRETKRLLDKSVNNLSDQQRKVYFLCHVEGLSYEEAAKKLGVSKNTLKTHLKAALKHIRKDLLAGDRLTAILCIMGLLR
ncbi:RNA polymerase sigma factor [Sphingobacterium bambusae]|uniref:RNA polymerase sigma factor n=1 Tax=Sphingobacterium bambusae TaxID=662858 RepID=UPI002A18BA7C|nr:sigma-70 family RNA polymerase sigma factor [Sphingobacterium bambusae]WPL51097.1 sigma-70 family RNA polymerase sigma factor [Sphingobacterium bambusae]